MGAWVGMALEAGGGVCGIPGCIPANIFEGVGETLMWPTTAAFCTSRAARLSSRERKRLRHKHNSGPMM
jgi:hypothetical protein